jgi:hypothetical protein
MPVPKWGGGGSSGEIDMGEVLFGGASNKQVDKETEWEVSNRADLLPNY